MGKTLYISDLDGTLLHSNQQISQYSCDIINSLVKNGMIFSYATARSVHTAKNVTKGLTAKIPLAVYNGAFIVDNQTLDIITSNTFSDSETSEIYGTLTAHDIYPIVYSLVNGIEKFSYCTKTLSQPLSEFIDTRKGDFRDRPLDSETGILDGEKFYFTCIDSKDKLFKAYTILKEKYNCFYQTDIYSKKQWLEIMPTEATKANAVLRLKKLLQCDKVVSFGDAVNDIPMLKISDEFYAVENATDELKALATAVIDSNNNDGVAKWLLENYK